MLTLPELRSRIYQYAVEDNIISKYAPQVVRMQCKPWDERI